jgi:V/A-type H+/Na+-transporting ATPase subunit D
MPIRRPPGRAGRIWLARRLEVARRGAELLDLKLHALAGEEGRLAGEARARDRRWAEAAAEAGRWGLRAALLGGSSQLLPVPGGETARADVRWGTWMGVTYPMAAELRPGAPGPATIGGSAAFDVAVGAYRAASEAALASASSARALELVRAELADTRRRHRTLETRWIPLLEAELRRADQTLDELEREDRVRARWSRGRAHRTRW